MISRWPFHARPRHATHADTATHHSDTQLN